MRKVDAKELALNLTGKSGDAKTLAALTFGRRVLETRGHVTDADLLAVRSAGYSDADVVEIVAVTVDNIFTNYLNNVAKTAIDFPLVSTGQES
jgi:alkylhydroperoxidase family enzyme